MMHLLCIFGRKGLKGALSLRIESMHRFQLDLVLLQFIDDKWPALQALRKLFACNVAWAQVADIYRWLRQ